MYRFIYICRWVADNDLMLLNNLVYKSCVSHIWFMLRIAIMNNHSLSSLLQAKNIQVSINQIALALAISIYCFEYS